MTAENERPEHPLRRIWREQGIPMAPPGHWIYNEKPSTVFSPRTSSPSKQKASGSTPEVKPPGPEKK